MNDKKILIIGGSGALGQALIKRYSKENTIMIYSRDEHKHHHLSNQFPTVEFKIGDIKDRDSLRETIEDFKPQVIINAAAMKHVPMCESNLFESINVNIIGNHNLIQCVKLAHHKINNLIFISSDKACQPINTYGMSKSISERLYVDFANKQRDIRVSIVRYGNVLESTGSVIPFFKKLLEKGETVLPITSMEMTRFFISLNEAVDLIDFAYNGSSPLFTSGDNLHGCICIPRLPSLSIPNVAKELFKWKGIDGTLKEGNVRKGEKIHEMMISDVEWLRTLGLDKDNVYIITDDIISNNKSKSYTSKNNVLNEKDTYRFLRKHNVI